MSADADILRLCAAGAIADISRVGHAPFDVDDSLEITFESGAVFHVDIGFEGATDIVVREGPLLDRAFGHLRIDEPQTFAVIARDWTREALDLPWVVGQKLTHPRRLIMIEPYRVEIGYVFEIGGQTLALFGEADLIFAAALDDPEIETYNLEIGALILA